MSARNSNANRARAASKQSDASSPQQDLATHEALQTFAVDVSAGRKLRLDRPQAREALSNQFSGNCLGETSSEPAAVERSIPLAIELPETLAVGDPVQPSSMSRGTRGRHKFPTWWVASLSMHALLLLGLGYSTLVIIQQQEFQFTSSPVDYDLVEEFEDVALDLSEEFEPLDEPSEELLEPMSFEEIADPLERLALEIPTQAPTPGEPASADGPPAQTELTNPLGEVGGGKPAPERTDGEASASFFGTKVKARRILYMLDNSGGMLHDGKFEALVNELQTSISQLQPRQQFYVVFYSDTVYPLFYPHSVMEFVRPNKRVQRQLAAWLDSVELCTGNAIDEALAAAEVIRPDAIFLLTDGDLFTTAKKRDLLMDSAGRSYAIYTFGMGVSESGKTGEKLRQVAEANGGTCQFIEISDKMKSLAETRQRPYHIDRPGAVWGLKVR